MPRTTIKKVRPRYLGLRYVTDLNQSNLGLGLSP